MSTMSIIARALLRDSWTHLQIAFAPTVTHRDPVPPPPAPPQPKPWKVGDVVVHVDDGGPPRMVLGYKPDGRCMTAYITAPPWMQRCLGTRVLIDEPEDLRALEALAEEWL